jgi:hypothetical protein
MNAWPTGRAPRTPQGCPAAIASPLTFRCSSAMLSSPRRYSTRQPDASPSSHGSIGPNDTLSRSNGCGTADAQVLRGPRSRGDLHACLLVARADSCIRQTPGARNPFLAAGLRPLAAMRLVPVPRQAGLGEGALERDAVAASCPVPARVVSTPTMTARGSAQLADEVHFLLVEFVAPRQASIAPAADVALAGLLVQRAFEAVDHRVHALVAEIRQQVGGARAAVA